MNRYSLVFAVLVAASFAVHSPHAGEQSSSGGDEKKLLASHRIEPKPSEPVSFIKEFFARAQYAPGEHPGTPRVLFATVAHPTETHLAAAFDHDVEALQDGLQTSGYLFDSSWIPWKVHEPHEQFDDEKKESDARVQEDLMPGVLLFRNKERDRSHYGDGLIVFLVTEKPTGGIALPQVDSAMSILSQAGISIGKQLRILGPSFSGSFASLVPAIGSILKAAPGIEQVFLRSGSVTGGHAARRATKELAALWPAVTVDFGSTSHDYEDRIAFVEANLARIGISQNHAAILTEGESLYGDMYEIVQSAAQAEQQRLSSEPVQPSPAPTAEAREDNRRHSDIAEMWRVPFPRDISSVRAGYESQGLFDANSPVSPWKRFLNLKQVEEGPGDSVRTFGGAETMAAKESVLFGISEFLKKHEILAVIILATNEQDRYFLSQFLHANNSGVRVVILDPTRLFLRGATAQFRGDMFVGEFPMLPLLHDWTGAADDKAGHVFADDVSQGIYFAAIDLLADETRQLRWFREYSEPNWNAHVNPARRPPMYMVALGSSATWPLAELATPHMVSDSTQPGRVEMPFTLFDHCPLQGKPCPVPAKAIPAAPIQVGRFWLAVFAAMLLLTGVYCFAFWYANPLLSSTFASFDPSPAWRFWLFKAAIPAAVAGGAFRVLAWSVEIPSTLDWWRWCEVLMFLAPLAIASSAVVKALKTGQLEWSRQLLVPFVPSAVALIALLTSGIFSSRPFRGRDIGSVLNTFREMHWESGLSLLPTAMLLLLAFLIWACESGNGAALLYGAPPLPCFTSNARISDQRGREIASIGCPWPSLHKMRWIWLGWAAAAAAIYSGQFIFRPFREITTLESRGTTELVFAASATITVLMLFDLMLFIRLWFEARDLLRALYRTDFKRSFVTIEDFNWKSLWTFTGISFESRRAISTALIDCLTDLARNQGITALLPSAITVEALRSYYNVTDLRTVSRRQFKNNARLFACVMRQVADGVALLLENPPYMPPAAPVREVDEAHAVNPAPYVLQCNCSDAKGRFSDESDEQDRLPGWQKAAERLICLMYISFIHTIVARLHTLLVSIAFTFSLMALALAIYPFAPLNPLVSVGVGFLLLIGWAFFKVFKEMNDDPILARIVTGDDGKTKGSAYLKFAEAIALPLLTLASSLLPGGAGRLLELAQTLFNHGQ